MNKGIAERCYLEAKRLGLTDDEADEVIQNLIDSFKFNERQTDFFEYVLKELEKVEEKK